MIKEFIKICKKCGTPYTILCKEHHINNPKKVRQTCSNKCANSRTHSDTTKRKISTTLKSKVITKPKYKDLHLTHVCIVCEREFIKNYPDQLLCSSECARKFNIQNVLTNRRLNSDGWSRFQKTLYATGVQKVGGGKTKWYTYNTIKVQGTYELRTCLILDQMKLNGDIMRWTYATDRYSYIGIDGNSHIYIIDFKIYINANDFYYIETKGFVKPNDILKWETVRRYGHTLHTWFKDDLLRFESKYLIQSDAYKEYMS